MSEVQMNALMSVIPCLRIAVPEATGTTTAATTTIAKTGRADE